MATATLGYRTYIDEREAGSDFYPHHEIDVWLTGEVIDGPNVEYDNSDKADDWYRDRMDSFTLRVRGARFPDHGDLDVLIHAHNNSETGPLPPLWLARMRVGSLVQVRLVITDSEDLAALHALPGGLLGQRVFMAHTVRVFTDEGV